VVVYKLGPHLKMESAVVQGGISKEKIFSPRQVLNPGPLKSLWCVATNCTKGNFIPVEKKKKKKKKRKKMKKREREKEKKKRREKEKE
jgi:hypothetical protein